MDLTRIITVLGVLAFLVSCIVEVVKELPYLKKIPTAIVVVIVSIVLCPTTMLAMASYFEKVITWYMVFASFIAAFVVSLVSMSGWERVNELYKRVKK